MNHLIPLLSRAAFLAAVAVCPMTPASAQKPPAALEIRLSYTGFGQVESTGAG